MPKILIEIWSYLNPPLEHGLVYSVDGHPGEVTSYGLRPERVPGQDGGVKVEQLDPLGLVAEPEFRILRIN